MFCVEVCAIGHLQLLDRRYQNLLLLLEGYDCYTTLHIGSSGKVQRYKVSGLKVSPTSERAYILAFRDFQKLKPLD